MLFDGCGAARVLHDGRGAARVLHDGRGAAHVRHDGRGTNGNYCRSKYFFTIQRRKVEIFTDSRIFEYFVTRFCFNRLFHREIIKNKNELQAFIS